MLSTEQETNLRITDFDEIKKMIAFTEGHEVISNAFEDWTRPEYYESDSTTQSVRKWLCYSLKLTENGRENFQFEYQFSMHDARRGSYVDVGEPFRLDPDAEDPVAPIKEFLLQFS